MKAQPEGLYPMAKLKRLFSQVGNKPMVGEPGECLRPWALQAPWDKVHGAALEDAILVLLLPTPSEATDAHPSSTLE